jgi:hypothetical protein
MSTKSKSPKIIKRLFVSRDWIDRMKSKANDCSSNDLLSALIFKSVSKARQIPPEKIIKCAYSVDIRKRMRPPLAEGYIGNAIIWAIVSVTCETILNQSLIEIARLFRKVTNDSTNADHIERTIVGL